MELEEVGAIKMPKMITAKMVPTVNIKLEINMGVISPFTQEYIGLGVNAAAHMATPLEMTLTRKLTQIALDIKVPEEIKRYLSINEFVTGEKIEEVQILRHPKTGSLLVVVLSCPQIGSLSSSTANQRAAQNNYQALGCQGLYFLNFVMCTNKNFRH